MTNIEKKTVVVAGAGRNIGSAMARRLLALGWTVYAGLLRSGWDEMAALSKEYPGALYPIAMDTSDLASTKKAAEEVAKTTGCVDMLIYNAAVFGNRADDFYGVVDFDSFLTTYDVNCLGALRMIQCFLPMMENGWKRLAFVSSEASANSVVTRSGVSNYSMSKSALSMAIRILFDDLQPKGWTFRVFHPGWVRSVKPEKGFVAGKYEPDYAGYRAIEMFLRPYDWDDRLVMLDIEDAAWPF